MFDILFVVCAFKPGSNCHEDMISLRSSGLSGPTKSNRDPTCCAAISEIMTILVMFQMSRFRDFKNFHNGFLKFYHKNCFHKLPSYERFCSSHESSYFLTYSMIKFLNLTGQIFSVTRNYVRFACCFAVLSQKIFFIEE